MGNRLMSSWLGGLVAAMVAWPIAVSAQSADADAPAFRSAVNLVSVSAVVKDRNGRPVRNLTRGDFTVLENGQPRPIVDFSYADSGPVSFGVLIDQSGSMAVSRNLDAAREVVRHLLAWFDPTGDEVALFAFDRDLTEVQAFTSDASAVVEALPRLQAFGTTALYDAVASTARALETRANQRRVLIVITDGLDTASTLTAPEVSAIASSIDVPVYVVAVMSPINHPETGIAPQRQAGEPVATNLANLAYWTGGDLLVATTPAETSQAARRLVVDLRHQYLLAFESSTEAGWHRVAVRTRQRGLQVRSRTGYIAEGDASRAP
jgi:Ca-activated chloride channel homolog